MMKAHRSTLAALLTALALAGCDYLPFGCTSIKDIAEVALKGTVKSAVIIGGACGLRNPGVCASL